MRMVEVWSTAFTNWLVSSMAREWSVKASEVVVSEDVVVVVVVVVVIAAVAAIMMD